MPPSSNPYVDSLCLDASAAGVEPWVLTALGLAILLALPLTAAPLTMLLLAVVLALLLWPRGAARPPRLYFHPDGALTDAAGQSMQLEQARFIGRLLFLAIQTAGREHRYMLWLGAGDWHAMRLWLSAHPADSLTDPTAVVKGQ